jgi:hypothetical protein
MRHESVARLFPDRPIAPGVMAALGRALEPEGILSRSEAEALILFDRALADPSTQWKELFSRTLAEHVVHREQPSGIVTEEQAAWFAAALAPQGRVETAAAMEALICVLEAARSAPPALSAFALAQVCASVIAGEGPAIGPRFHFSRMVDGEDVALIARILEAAGGEANAPVSRLEAEVLFDLHDAVAGEDNDSTFDTLFCRAIVNHVTSASIEMMQPRRTALAREARIGTALVLGAEERAWLYQRIMRDGRPTAAEGTLLALFDRGEGPQTPGPSLRRFLDHAG